MDAELMRFAAPAAGVVGTLVVTLLGIIIRRLYKSHDLLFIHVGRLDKRIKVLELVAMRSDPESTGLFKAITGEGKE